MEAEVSHALTVLVIVVPDLKELLRGEMTERVRSGVRELAHEISARIHFATLLAVIIFNLCDGGSHWSGRTQLVGSGLYV